MIKSIKNRITTTTEIEKSKFICTLAPVNSVDNALEVIDEIKSLHASATHNCYAYTLNNGSVQKCSDDGEPSRTAGYPILTALLNNNLDNVVCVVTRYFGGIKLGAGGLVRAYSFATVSAINNAQIVNYYDSSVFEISFDFTYINQIDRLLQVDYVTIIEKNFLEKVTYKINVCNKYIIDLEQKLVSLTKNTLLFSEKQASFIAR